MPEINEVRRYADFMRSKLAGRELKEINILKGRYKTHGHFDLYTTIVQALPLKVLDVQSKGKFIYITLENEYYIFCTLGLAGGWVYKKGDKYKYAKQNYGLQHVERALDHLNVEFKTSEGPDKQPGGSLYFFDQLSYGTLKGIKGTSLLNKRLNEIGPDIMDVNTTFVIFKDRI